MTFLAEKPKVAELINQFVFGIVFPQHARYTTINCQ